MNRENYPSIAHEIFGWLKVDEAWTLWDLAKAVPRNGVIVEIGSFIGKSTVCLGDGSKAGNMAIVYTVDHHQGSEEHYQMFNIPQGHRIDTLPQLRENIFKAGLKEIVQAIVKTSEDAAKEFKHEIDLLFIDGSHKHDDVKADFEMWTPKLKQDGILVLHDVYYWPGPTRLLTEIFYDDRHGWDFDIYKHLNMAILKRVP